MSMHPLTELSDIGDDPPTRRPTSETNTSARRRRRSESSETLVAALPSAIGRHVRSADQPLPSISDDGAFPAGRSLRAWLEEITRRDGKLAAIAVEAEGARSGDVRLQLELARQALAACLDDAIEPSAWWARFSDGVRRLRDVDDALRWPAPGDTSSEAALEQSGAARATRPGAFDGVDVLLALCGVSGVLDGVGFSNDDSEKGPRTAIITGPLALRRGNGSDPVAEDLRRDLARGNFSSACFTDVVTVAQAAQLLDGYLGFWRAHHERDEEDQALALRDLLGDDVTVALAVPGHGASVLHHLDFPEGDPFAGDFIYIPVPTARRRPWAQYLALVQALQQQRMMLSLVADASWREELRRMCGCHERVSELVVLLSAAMPNTAVWPIHPRLGSSHEVVRRAWRSVPSWLREDPVLTDAFACALGLRDAFVMPAMGTSSHLRTLARTVLQACRARARQTKSVPRPPRITQRVDE